METTRKCRKCQIEQPIAEFEVTNKAWGWRRWECRSCIKKRVQVRYAESKKIIRYAFTQKQLDWQKNEGREEHNRRCMASYYRNQHDAIMAYGGYRCACCGETEPLFLTIDHVNNDGNLQRSKHKRTGDGLYKWLRVNGYPEGFQVLCMNCNHGKRRNGGICPHKMISDRVNKLTKRTCNDHPITGVESSDSKRLAPKAGDDMVLTAWEHAAVPERTD